MAEVGKAAQDRPGSWGATEDKALNPDSIPSGPRAGHFSSLRLSFLPDTIEIIPTLGPATATGLPQEDMQ